MARQLEEMGLLGSRPLAERNDISSKGLRSLCLIHQHELRELAFNRVNCKLILKIIAASFVAPLGVIPTLILVALIAQILIPIPQSYLSEITIFILYAIPITFGFTIIFGIPIYIFLYLKGSTSFRLFALIGASGGLAADLYLSGISYSQIGLFYSSIFIACGISTSLIFRLIVCGTPQPRTPMSDLILKKRGGREIKKTTKPI